jgi:hypothetical protein
MFVALSLKTQNIESVGRFRIRNALVRTHAPARIERGVKFNLRGYDGLGLVLNARAIDIRSRIKDWLAYAEGVGELEPRATPWDCLAYTVRTLKGFAKLNIQT